MLTSGISKYWGLCTQSLWWQAASVLLCKLQIPSYPWVYLRGLGRQMETLAKMLSMLYGHSSVVWNDILQNADKWCLDTTTRSSSFFFTFLIVCVMCWFFSMCVCVCFQWLDTLEIQDLIDIVEFDSLVKLQGYYPLLGRALKRERTWVGKRLRVGSGNSPTCFPPIWAQCLVMMQEGNTTAANMTLPHKLNLDIDE